RLDADRLTVKTAFTMPLWPSVTVASLMEIDGTATTVTAALNSDVLPPGSVAVAVTRRPVGMVNGSVVVKEALPAASVVTAVEQAYAWPSPKPDGSAAMLAKKSSVKVVFGVLLSVPRTVAPVKVLTAALRTGKFCRLFGPASASPASLTVTPAGKRSIP